MEFYGCLNKLLKPRTMKKSLLFASLIFGSFTIGAQGLENIIVETYYISDANDATMDADGSHLVDDLAVMLDLGPEIDVVMGSRWIPGGLVTNWSNGRKFLSKFGTWYARRSLALPYRDLTGGLRVYDRNVLEGINFSQIRSNGYCFQIEMIRKLHAHGAFIKEIPIHFIERQGGVSKMSKVIVLEAFFRVSLWGVQRVLRINADKLHYVK
jgi:dolichol-phosphate mannosyltransferase